MIIEDTLTVVLKLRTIGETSTILLVLEDDDYFFPVIVDSQNDLSIYEQTVRLTVELTNGLIIDVESEIKEDIFGISVYQNKELLALARFMDLFSCSDQTQTCSTDIHGVNLTSSVKCM